jgi:hypothetical protein
MRIQLLKNNRLVKGFLALILVSLLTIWIFQLIWTYDDFYLASGIELNIWQLLLTIFYSNSFIRPTLLILAIIGFFINNKIGWGFILIFFYFLFFEISFLIYPLIIHSWDLYLFMMIVALILGFLNVKPTRKVFKTKPDSLTINLIAANVALILTYIKGYIYLNHRLIIWDIIDKIS